MARFAKLASWAKNWQKYWVKRLFGLIRIVLSLLAILILLVGSATLGCWWCVRHAMQPQPLQPAQVAIVLGASVWPEATPSPTLASRTLAAVYLYDENMVQWIATTGGVSGDYPSEGSVAAALAQQHGVSEDRLLIEGTSTNTWQNLKNLMPLLQEQGISDAIIVSDSFHLGRAQRMAYDLGLQKVQVYACQSVFSDSTMLWYEFREVAALMSYLFLGPGG